MHVEANSDGTFSLVVAGVVRTVVNDLSDVRTTWAGSGWEWKIDGVCFGEAEIEI